MKTPTQVVADIDRKLKNYWHTDLTGDTNTWPLDVPLGQPIKADLETNFAAFVDRILDWHTWAHVNNVTLRTTTRRVRGTDQTIPTHLVVPDIDTAARLAGNDWVTALAEGRSRLATLTEQFPDATTAKTLRSVNRYDPFDFALLIDVAHWFTRHHTTAVGLTPRQVPIPGVHAKWLNTSQPDLLALTGLQTLGIADRHPPRIHFTYLDPNHRAADGRWHDSATVGDNFTPAYSPTLVLISENKDTAINFPEVPGGIAVEGEGFGGKTAAAFPWLTDAPVLLYWGDIDTHGYEILNGYRADGVPVTSILMDPATYEQYEPYGTNTDKAGRPLLAGERKPLPMLTEPERAVYEHLTAPEHLQHRRIEQERIPLSRALDTLNLVRSTHPEHGEHEEHGDGRPLRTTAERDEFGTDERSRPLNCRRLLRSAGQASQARTPNTP